VRESLEELQPLMQEPWFQGIILTSAPRFQSVYNCPSHASVQKNKEYLVYTDYYIQTETSFSPALDFPIANVFQLLVHVVLQLFSVASVRALTMKKGVSRPVFVHAVNHDSAMPPLIEPQRLLSHQP
jgi:hypothetical protein